MWVEAVLHQQELINSSWLNASHRFLDTSNGKVTPIITMRTNCTDTRPTMVSGHSRRFWFGLECGSIKCSSVPLRSEWFLHVLQTGLTISNGLDGVQTRTPFIWLIRPQNYLCLFWSWSSGRISNRRVFIDLTAESFYPDGLTVDRGCRYLVS